MDETDIEGLPNTQVVSLQYFKTIFVNFVDKFETETTSVETPTTHNTEVNTAIIETSSPKKGDDPPIMSWSTLAEPRVTPPTSWATLAEPY